MIELDHVVKTYGDRRIVDDVSLTVETGAFCVLVGTSGSGKSTTLRMINRLLPLDGGRIRIGGEDITSIPPEMLRRRIGYVIQSVGLFPHWTIADNIATVPRLLKWPARKIEARVDELLALLQLDGSYRDKYPHQLSGGQQQRIGVARALAADPELLLMDEPFGALDPITRESLRGELSQIHAATGKTIVFVTHDMDEALSLADTLAILHEGKLVQAGKPQQILDEPANDFVRALIGQSELGLKRLALQVVRDRLRPGLGCEGQPVEETLSLKEALSQMIARHVDCLPVSDAAGRVIGAIRLDDMVR